MKNLSKIVTYIFGILVAMVALLLIASTFDVPGNLKFMIVTSGSMEPAVKTGGIIVTKPSSTYQAGDIITFGPAPKGKMPTTHRVVDSRAVSGQMLYKTKGDANEEADFDEVKHKDIWGKVILTVPYVGYILAAAKTPVGFGTLIGIPVLILMYDESKKIYLEIKKLRAKKNEEAVVVEEKKENE